MTGGGNGETHSFSAGICENKGMGVFTGTFYQSLRQSGHPAVGY